MIEVNGLSKVCPTGKAVPDVATIQLGRRSLSSYRAIGGIDRLSLHWLLDPPAVVAGSVEVYVRMAILVGIAAVLYMTGMIYFGRRDLHV